MNACERYLAVFNDDKRKKLDRVPTHVQYIRDEFIAQNKNELLENYKGQLFNISYFDIPLILGFDAVFAPFPSSVKINSITIKDSTGNKVRINANGEAVLSNSPYYQGGYIHSLEILDRLRVNLKRIDRSKQIKDMITRYEKLSPSIFPVLAVDGIFDKVWKSMGMSVFSHHFRKKTKLYRELIKFYAEISRLNIEGLIQATGGKGKILNILDDIAYKSRTMISPERWNQDFLPHYKEINSLITDANMIPQIHTDGDATDMISSFQKSGFQGLQGWEGGCDPFYINKHFPDFVVIGFGDVSNVLPFGTPDHVDAHVKNLMDTLKENRHFVLGPSTVIFKEIPLENVKAFIAAARKYGKY